MRKVMGIVVVVLAAFCASAWAADAELPAQAASSSLCTPSDLGNTPELQADLFSPQPLPAACSNTCGAIQNQPCSTDGQHFFCTWSSCLRWGCTCMDGIIECGLP
jgi:hypothetical protein